MQKQYNGGIIDDNYSILDYLEEGSQSYVFTAKDIEKDEIVAIKVLLKDNKLFNESEILQKLKGVQYVVQIKKTKKNGLIKIGNKQKKIQYIVLEYIQYSLFDEFMAEKKPSQNKIKNIILQLCESIDILHKNNVIHGDLKMENIQIDTNGNIRLIDFGNSQYLDKYEIISKSGTKIFNAPEMLFCDYIEEIEKSKESADGAKQDIFQMGQLIFILIYGVRPYDLSNEKDILYELLYQNPEKYWQIIETQTNHYNIYLPEFKQLFPQIVAFHPKKRITMQNIFQSDFIQYLYRDKHQQYS